MNPTRERFPSHSCAALCRLTHAKQHDFLAHAGHVYLAAAAPHASHALDAVQTLSHRASHARASSRAVMVARG
jgi:hypothetical protein